MDIEIIRSVILNIGLLVIIAVMLLNFGVQKYRTTDITSFNVISVVLFCTLILNSSSDPV